MNPNVFCFSAKDCHCPPGYTNVIDNSTCVPVCDENCINGMCTKPNECECFDGFDFDKSSKIKCVPVCDGDCSNGECVAPDECICNKGFIYNSPNTTSICDPICETPCVNGRCTFPDKCECNPGYFLKNNACHEEIVLKTTAVSNKCEDNTYLINGTCQNCSENCKNSICSKPNFCECNDGFHKGIDNSIWNECYAICDLDHNCTKTECNNNGFCQCSTDAGKIICVFCSSENRNCFEAAKYKSYNNLCFK